MSVAKEDVKEVGEVPLPTSRDAHGGYVGLALIRTLNGEEVLRDYVVEEAITRRDVEGAIRETIVPQGEELLRLVETEPRYHVLTYDLDTWDKADCECSSRLIVRRETAFDDDAGTLYHRPMEQLLVAETRVSPKLTERLLRRASIQARDKFAHCEEVSVESGLLQVVFRGGRSLQLPVNAREEIHNELDRIIEEILVNFDHTHVGYV